MPVPLENARSIRAKGIPVNRPGRSHTEPLRCNRMPVLHARIAHIAYRDPGEFRELLGDPMGIVGGFFNPQVIVLTIAAEFDS